MDNIMRFYVSRKFPGFGGTSNALSSINDQVTQQKTFCARDIENNPIEASFPVQFPAPK